MDLKTTGNKTKKNIVDPWNRSKDRLPAQSRGPAGARTVTRVFGEATTSGDDNPQGGGRAHWGGDDGVGAVWRRLWRWIGGVVGCNGRVGGGEDGGAAAQAVSNATVLYTANLILYRQANRQASSSGRLFT